MTQRASRDEHQPDEHGRQRQPITAGAEHTLSYTAPPAPMTAAVLVALLVGLLLAAVLLARYRKTGKYFGGADDACNIMRHVVDVGGT